MRKQAIAAILPILLGLGVGAAPAAERAAIRPQPGFYGGVVLRDQGIESQGLALGVPATAVSSFGVLSREDNLSRSLMYGGYRFGNDVAVEASVNAADPYALQPSQGVRTGRGPGVVASAGSLPFADSSARTWNVDVYTSWSFLRSFSLYGRLGYAQTDLNPAIAASLASSSDARRLRDGLNYGLGVRYDMTSALGLRLEYGRFGRFASDPASSAQDSDRVTFGLQFRF